VRAVRIARAIMTARAMAPLQVTEIAPGAGRNDDDEVLDWVKSAAETTYHPVGTCKMGSDAMAVVDAQLRVVGIDGAAGRRRLDHADTHVGQYQRAVDHDWRKGGGHAAEARRRLTEENAPIVAPRSDGRPRRRFGNPFDRLVRQLRVRGGEAAVSIRRLRL